MKMMSSLFEVILSRYSSVPPERGGILGMVGDVVQEYVHDDAETVLERAVYVPDITFLNQCIREWSSRGVKFAGMVHSHPPNQRNLSSGDLEFIKRLYQHNPDLWPTYFPLVIQQRELVVFRVMMSSGSMEVEKDNLLFV